MDASRKSLTPWAYQRDRGFSIPSSMPAPHPDPYPVPFGKALPPETVADMLRSRSNAQRDLLRRQDIEPGTDKTRLGTCLDAKSCKTIAPDRFDLRDPADQTVKGNLFEPHLDAVPPAGRQRRNRVDQAGLFQTALNRGKADGRDLPRARGGAQHVSLCRAGGHPGLQGARLDQGCLCRCPPLRQRQEEPGRQTANPHQPKRQQQGALPPGQAQQVLYQPTDHPPFSGIINSISTITRSLSSDRRASCISTLRSSAASASTKASAAAKSSRRSTRRSPPPASQATDCGAACALEITGAARANRLRGDTSFDSARNASRASFRTRAICTRMSRIGPLGTKVCRVVCRVSAVSAAISASVARITVSCAAAHNPAASAPVRTGQRHARIWRTMRVRAACGSARRSSANSPSAKVRGGGVPASFGSVTTVMPASAICASKAGNGGPNRNTRSGRTPSDR